MTTNQILSIIHVALQLGIVITLVFLLKIELKPLSTATPKVAKRYVYFVSYFFVDGNGRVEIALDKRITQINDLSEIEKWIRLEYNISNLVITNYILLREE